MSGLDAAFLYGETPNWHMHVSCLMVVDPSDSEDGWSFEAYRDLLLSRLAQAPQFRWRLVDVPLGIDRPGWVEDVEIDAEHHVRRVGLPAPGGDAELGELVGRLVSFKIDRTRPLWESWVIEGLEGGRIAILTKMHHSIVDGASGAGLAEVLLDLEPTPREASQELVGSLRDERVPSWPELVAWGAVRTYFRSPYKLMRFTRQTRKQLFSAIPMMRNERSDHIALPMQAPRTTLNQDPTPARRFASAKIELDRVKAIKTAHGVKLNDVVVALCAGALRMYLESIDDMPEESLTVQCPVSLRSSNEDGDDVGNHVGSMFATMATDIDDPGERLQAIHASTSGAKEMQEAMSVHRIMGLTDTTPPGLINLAARMYTGANLSKSMPPPVNVVVSNVPGPPFDLYVAGSRLEAMYPMGPLLMGMALNITVFSCGGHLDFGLMCCPTAVEEVGQIARNLEIALDELEAAEVPPPLEHDVDEAEEEAASA